MKGRTRKQCINGGVFFWHLSLFFRFDAFKQLFSLVKNNSSLSLSYFHNFCFLSPSSAHFLVFFFFASRSLLLFCLLIFILSFFFSFSCLRSPSLSLRVIMWICVSICYCSSRKKKKIIIMNKRINKQGKRGY